MLLATLLLCAVYVILVGLPVASFRLNSRRLLVRVHPAPGKSILIRLWNIWSCCYRCVATVAG